LQSSLLLSVKASEIFIIDECERNLFYRVIIG